MPFDCVSQKTFYQIATPLEASSNINREGFIIDNQKKTAHPINVDIENQIIYWIEYLGSKISEVKQIKIRKDNDQFRFVVEFQDSSSFSDNSFALLKAFQHIIRNLIHSSYPKDRTHFCIDINSEQRKKREIFLKEKVLNLVQNQLIVKGKTLIITNLTSYERFIVHKLFHDTKNIETNSVGTDEKRKMMIFPTNDTTLAGLESAVMLDVDAEFKKHLETEKTE